MKLLLINPPCELSSPLPNLGLGALSAYIKYNKHDSKIIDLWATPLSDNQLKETILNYSPDLIGISFYTNRYHITKKLIETIKGWFPEKKIVVGGPHASALPQELLREVESIDIVVIGEGEETLLEVLESVRDGMTSKINGIAFQSNGNIVVTPTRPYLKNLDALPYNDFAQIESSKYKIHPPYGWFGFPLPMITTRGCPGKCIFCSKSVYKNHFRSMSPKRVVDEIKYWKHKIPVKEIRFFDDDFTIAKSRTFEICDLMIKEKVNLPWTCTTRVDFLTKEMLIAMKASGLYFIVLGVESGSPKVLKSLRKGYTVEHIKNAFKWCHELDITTFAFFMVGSPDEEDEDIKKTIQIQKEIKPNFLSWSILRIFPGSALFDYCKDKIEYNLTPESQYIDIFRKDVDIKVLRNIQSINMFKHYLTPVGIRSVLNYLLKTKNFNAIKDYIQISTDKRNK